MLTIGDQLPAFRLTSVVDIDQARPEDAFEVIESDNLKYGWRIVFF